MSDAKRIEIPVGGTHTLDDGRVVRCVKSNAKGSCVACVFSRGDREGCDKPEPRGRLVCIGSQRHNNEPVHFELVPELEAEFVNCTAGNIKPEPEAPAVPASIPYHAVGDVFEWTDIRLEAVKSDGTCGGCMYREDGHCTVRQQSDSYNASLAASKCSPSSRADYNHIVYRSVPAPSAVEQIRAKVLDETASFATDRPANRMGQRILAFIDALPSEEPQDVGESLIEERDTNRRQVSRLQAKLASSQTRGDGLHAANIQLGKTLEKQRAENERLQAEVQKLKDAQHKTLIPFYMLEEARQRTIDVKKQLADAESHNTELQTIREKQSGIILGLRAELTEWQSSHKHISDRRNTRLKEVSALKQQLADAEQERDEAHRCITGVERKAERLESRVRAECQAEFDEQLSDRQGELDDIQQQLAYAKRDNEDLKGEHERELDERESTVKAEFAKRVREECQELLDLLPIGSLTARGEGKMEGIRIIRDHILAELEPQAPATMGFADAMAALREGKRVRRREWNYGVYVQRHDTDDGVLWKRCANGDNTTWCVMLVEINATDWVVVKEASDE